MKVLALVNHKGGVAKTTTAINLAAGLADGGRRILLVDLDGQASASLSLGIPRAQLLPSSADVIIDGVAITDGIRHTGVVGMHLLTGSRHLANADIILGNLQGRELRLKYALDGIRDTYDFIVLDCPPSLSLITVNALVAADVYLVPVVSHYLALEGLINLTEAVRLIRQGIGTCAEFLGIVMTMVDSRTKASKEIIRLIREHYGDSVFNTEIRANVRLQEAPSHGKTIFQYDRYSNGASDYRSLAKEVIGIGRYKQEGY